MSRRPKILMVSEFHQLATGYSVLSRELLTRWYATGKYEIAELACYVPLNDPRIQQAPWKVYANAPMPEQQDLINQYNANPTYQFGSWRFEEVVLNFKPDIVINLMDPWMMEYCFYSPLRPYYKLAVMPTVDSLPQQEAWINMFSQADAVFTYSDYGLKGLEKEGGGKIKLRGTASPAANPDHYFPIFDKEGHKSAAGFRPESIIIGTVMRNQKRKLYPDIMDAFNLYLDKCTESNNQRLGRDSFLYFHISYPDVGWDVPDLLKKKGLSHKVLFTYMCKNPNCKHTFPSFFADSRTFCPRCNQYSAGLPNTQHFVDSQTLGQIVNLFDVYLQYSIAEGFALPVVEAAACGVPVMGTNYSALEDNIAKVGGTLIPVEREYLEAETQAIRVYPNNEILAQELYRFFNLPKPVRIKKIYDTKKRCDQHYSYDKSAKMWMDFFDEVVPNDNVWQSPPRINQPQTQLPNIVDNSTFVKWAIVNILGEPDKLNTYLEHRMVKDLNYGAYVPGFGGLYLSEHSFVGTRPNWQLFGRQEAAQRLYELAQSRNYWEQRRVGLISPPEPDYITYHKREKV